MSRVRRIVKARTWLRGGPANYGSLYAFGGCSVPSTAHAHLLITPLYFCALIWSPLVDESSPPDAFPTIRSVADPHQTWGWERERGGGDSERWHLAGMLRRRVSTFYIFRLRDFSARMIFGANFAKPLWWGRVFLFCQGNSFDISSEIYCLPIKKSFSSPEISEQKLHSLNSLLLSLLKLKRLCLLITAMLMYMFLLWSNKKNLKKIDSSE